MKAWMNAITCGIFFKSAVVAMTFNVAYAIDSVVIPKSSDQDDELEFDTLDISAKKSKNEDKPYVTGGAISTKEIKGNETQSLDSIVRSMPGTYTNTDQSQGTLQVNIRGMTGLGRVNTMIDGVSQTYFGTSGDNGAVHGQTTSTSAFGAAIDSSFLVGVDVQRGGFNGGSGANALMGSANFKTIGVEDVINPKHTYGGVSVGVLSRISYGTNGIGPAFMGALASSIQPHGENSKLGVLFAYSIKHTTQDYRIGGGGSIGNQNIDTDGDGMPDSIAPYNPKTLTQTPQGYLAKIEYEPNLYHKLIFSYRKYLNSLAGRNIDNNNYQINYTYKPDSEWIDIALLMAYNDGFQKYDENALLWGNSAAQNGLSAKNQALSFDLSNKLMLHYGDFTYIMKLGTNMLFNYYSNTLDASRMPGSDSMPFQPKGKQYIVSAYMDNTFTYKMLEFSTNLNVTNWSLIGHRGVCDEVNFHCFPKNAIDINKNGWYVNSYNILTLKLHDFFMPFVSYARTNRAPNVQEMFFSNNQGNSINPFLKPETADTYQIGFNAFRQNLFMQDDSFGFKLLYYHSSVQNYIYNDGFYVENSASRQSSQFIMFLNSTDLATFNGVELETQYDMPYFFTRIAYSWQTSKQPISETMLGGSEGFGYSRLSLLPQDYATIDLGVKLFLDGKLILGSIVKYTGKARRLYPDGEREEGDPNDWYPTPLTQELPRIPTIWDMYISYTPFEYCSVRFEIQNLLDENYLDALNAYNGTPNQSGVNVNGDSIYLFSNSARGRTYVISAQLKF